MVTKLKFWGVYAACEAEEEEEEVVVLVEEVVAGMEEEEVVVVLAGAEEEEVVEEVVVGVVAGVEEEEAGCRMAVVNLLLAIQLGAWQNRSVGLSGRPRVVQRRIVAGTHTRLPPPQEWMLPRWRHQSPPRIWHQCKQGNMGLHLRFLLFTSIQHET